VKRFVIPLSFGLLGAAVLVALGVWQLQRLEWKQGILAEIEARIAAAPVSLPEDPDPQADRYLPVRVTGRMGERALRVLVSQKRVGAGYRLISVLDTGARRIMVDRGFIPVDADIPDPPPGEVTVTGNLHWPQDRNSSTPDNDIAGNTWFARDLQPMARQLDTRPVMVIAREVSYDDGPVAPLPVDTSGIPNDHLEYAITWFSLAGIWLGMTGYYLWRKRRSDKGGTA
jgi:surfeit locus 1 family protein